MSSHVTSLEASLLGQVGLIGLIFGAGIPILFALGIRAMAFGTGGSAEVSADGRPASAHPAGKVVAGVIFAVILFIVVLGIMEIIAGGFHKALSFEHVYPTLITKK